MFPVLDLQRETPWEEAAFLTASPCLWVSPAAEVSAVAEGSGSTRLLCCKEVPGALGPLPSYGADLLMGDMGLWRP